jgi:hypothetical protein
MGDIAAQFPLITLQRQLASSIPAMLEHYRQLFSQSAPTTSDDDDDDESDDPRTPETFRLINDPKFRELIRECLDLPRGDTDTKFAELLKVVKSADKIVVFSYFRGSLSYLERRLTEAGIHCVRIDGSVPSNPDIPEEDERQRRIEQFRDDPKVRVLLSSEVGSEGLDFQFCHTMANWDLPWNPMVVEQRIGRLDRLGQRSQRIIIVNFSIPGTIEDRILNRLYQRVGLFEGAIGPLEPILGQQIKELTDKLLDPRLSPAEIDRIVDQKARWLEQRLSDEQRFDESGQSLIGQDAVFFERLERIRKLGRFISPSELRLFAQDFLQIEIPDAVLRPRGDGPRGRDAGAGCEWLRVSQRLREFMRQQLPINDAGLIRFLERGFQNDLKATFDPTIAIESPTVEHIHAHHPLVRSILRFHDQAPDRTPPLSRAIVRSQGFTAGEYFFAWAEIIEEGLQGGRSVWAEAVRLDDGQRLSPDEAETLIYHAVVKGGPWENFPDPEPTAILELLTSCEDQMRDRVATRRAEALRQNSARVDARVASLEASHRAKLREREARLQYHQERANERVIPLFEAQIRKLEADYEERRRKLEAGRRVAVSYTLSGAGLLSVINE